MVLSRKFKTISVIIAALVGLIFVVVGSASLYGYESVWKTGLGSHNSYLLLGRSLKDAWEYGRLSQSAGFSILSLLGLMIVLYSQWDKFKKPLRILVSLPLICLFIYAYFLFCGAISRTYSNGGLIIPIAPFILSIFLLDFLKQYRKHLADSDYVKRVVSILLSIISWVILLLCVSFFLNALL